MKQRSRPYKTHPDLRQRRTRTLLWAIAVGALASATAALVIYVASLNNGR